MVKADEYMLWKARTELLFEKQKERDGLMKTVLEKIGEHPGGLAPPRKAGQCARWPGAHWCPLCWLRCP